MVAAAKNAGVTFMERVSDGELIVEGLEEANIAESWSRRRIFATSLSPAVFRRLASLRKTWYRPVYINHPQHATAEVSGFAQRVLDWIGHRARCRDLRRSIEA